MTAFAPPAVAWRDEHADERALVIPLHARRSGKADIISRADRHPDGLCVDQLLQRPLGQLADKVGALPDTERIEQS